MKSPTAMPKRKQESCPGNTDINNLLIKSQREMPQSNHIPIKHKSHPTKILFENLYEIHLKFLEKLSLLDLPSHSRDIS